MLKEAKVANLAKKSYDIVKEELSGKPSRRKRMQHAASSTGETSDRSEIVVVPVKQSPWSKKWELLKEKVGLFLYDSVFSNQIISFVIPDLDSCSA